MDDAKRFEVRQVVAAPIEQVFAVVADPRKHVGIDGSGMLQRTDSGQRAGGRGWSSVRHGCVSRFSRPLPNSKPGDRVRTGCAPELGAVPRRFLSVPLVDKLANITTVGHTYTYQLREVAGGTEITQIYDWSGVKDPQFESFCPFVSREELADTLAKLAREVEGAS
jgi:hypothetical protein